MRLAYLGEQSHHYDNLRSHLGRVGIDIPTLNLPAYMAREEGWVRNKRPTLLGRTCNRVKHVCSQIHGVLDKEYENRLIRTIDEQDIGYVLAYWGTNPLAEIIAIKKRRPHVKVILNVLCHPLGLSRAKIYLQNRLMRHALQFLDGLIFPSQTMVSYFASRIFNGSHVASLVLPPLFGESFHPRQRLPECPHQPSLIFLGRMDWWDGQSTDNVLSIIDQLIQQKIHVFHSDKTGSFPHHPFRHTFAPMPMHELAAYSTQFDASLVVYETGACECDDRFRNTVPDRFLMSVAAGVPIAIPRDGYDACKEILRNYRAVFEYDSYGKLYDQLSDRGRVARMRAVACENRRLYDEDAYVFKMIDFLESLC